MNVLLKAKYSFYSALVFFLCANPETYKIVNHFLGPLLGLRSGLASPTGCPTAIGLFFQTLLFFAVILALMMFPRDHA
jgi:hypothetical protein